MAVSPARVMTTPRILAIRATRCPGEDQAGARRREPGQVSPDGARCWAETSRALTFSVTLCPLWRVQVRGQPERFSETPSQ